MADRLFYVAPDVIYVRLAHDPETSTWNLRVAVSERQEDGDLAAHELSGQDYLEAAEAAQQADLAVLGALGLL